MTEVELFKKLSTGHKSAVGFIYDNYKNEGIALMSRYGIQGSKVEDYFQEAMISLLTNIRSGKYKGESTIKTYFFSILKYSAFGAARKNKKLKLSSIEGFDIEDQEDFEPFDDSDIHQLRRALEDIDVKCKQLLTGYYFESIDLKSLAEKLELTYNFIRQKKMRCLKNLRTIYEKP